MISKAVLYHILVIWGLAQVTAHVNRGGIPAAVRSSMIANGWRPLTTYENKNSGVHSSHSNDGETANERHSGPHPVHGKLQEHMATSGKLASKQNNKHYHDYNAPSILGTFNVYGHGLTKPRPEAPKTGHVKSNNHLVGSETREFSFLVPPPREPVRYEIDPYRKVILRDNEPYLRQPFQQYLIPHASVQSDTRNSPYYQKGSASTHGSTTTKNRPSVSDYNGGGGIQQPLRQQQQQQQQQSPQQHGSFESLKLSNAKLYLQPPSAGGPLNFGHEQQATENLYERYPSSQHNQQLTQDGPGNFYSQINHPSPSYTPQTPERDQAFLVHESHEVNYATPASPGQSGLSAYSNFRPSSPYSSLHQPERYSSPRPATFAQSDKFVPSKLDNSRYHQQQNYGQYSHNVGNPNLDNSIVSSEPTYQNGIANTYYISEKQSLTPPAPTWSVPTKNKVTSEINEVLPKANRPAKFNVDTPNVPTARPNQQNVQNFLFPRPEVQQQQLQQQQYVDNPLALINQQPETIYETPESLSLKHFNEQQFRLQQQLLQRDRDTLREQELQRQQQQMELERLAALRNREKTSTRPSSETPRPTIEYIETTATYVDAHNQEEDIRKVPDHQYLQPEYQEHTYPSIRPDVGGPAVTDEVENVSVGDIYDKVTQQPEKEVTQEYTQTPSAGHRGRTRKPQLGGTSQEQQYRRRKPTSSTITTPALHENTNYHQEEYYHLSTLAPNPIVQSPGTSFSDSSSTLPSTTAIHSTKVPTATTITTRTTTTTTTTTTPRPRTRRPTSTSGSPGRRRRPVTTTTPEPESASPPVTYQQEEYTRYLESENEGPRRRKIKPSFVITQNNHYEVEPTTSTEQKRYEIQNYGHKLGSNEQEYLTESPETYNNEQVLPQQTYAYNNEQDSLFYTPNYDIQSSTGQEPTDHENLSYPTSSSNLQNSGGLPTESGTTDNTETSRNVYTNVPPEELFINTERILTTTTPLPTTSTTTTPTTTSARRVTAAPTRNIPSRTTTGIPSTTSVETSVTTRTSSQRIRPMRFGGNSTRPRFSIKDYKSRLDYRTRISTTTTETPSSLTNSRQKNGILKSNQEPGSENQPAESTTGRYRLMSRVPYKITSTTPSSHHSRRGGDQVHSTTERINKFTPKRRLRNNHLYRSKISSTTTTPNESSGPDHGSSSTTSSTTRHTSVRNENVFSSSIRRRPPHMKPPIVFTQSSDIKGTGRDSTEMIPEETSFYSSAISQLLVGTSTNSSSDKSNDVATATNETEIKDTDDSLSTIRVAEMSLSQNDATSSSQSYDNAPIRVDEMDGTEYSQATTTGSPNNYETAGQTEALVKENSYVTVDSQLEEDLFAKASQSVADLTSSASALYDKPGMFKAVSLSPSGAEGASIINSRFRINQDKPTLPIEAFFHELSNKN